MSTAIPMANFLPGMQVYKYQLKYRVGTGNFGEVWLATDSAVGHDYAIKILRPGIPVNDRLREAQIGHSLAHNNLVRVHQADVINFGGNDLVIIAMDYLPDGSIAKLANPSGFFPMPEVIRLGMNILRGLEYLHSQNFFHNDVKPENALIEPRFPRVFACPRTPYIRISHPLFRRIEMFKKLLATEKNSVLTVLRVTLGVVMFAHGAQKMFGWFGGKGLDAALHAPVPGKYIPVPLSSSRSVRSSSAVSASPWGC